MITVLGPKGGTGKTVTSSNLVVALALEGKSTVLVDLDLQFGDVGLALGLRADPDDLRPRRLGRLARRREDRRLSRRASLRGAGAACTASSGSGGGDRDSRSCARCSRFCARATTSSSSTLLRLSRRGDRGRGCFVASLRRRDARRALAQGHEDRARDAGADGLRPEGGHARAQPCGLGRGHHAGGCRAAARTGARRARRQRPRDSACTHERPADRGGRAAVEGGSVVRSRLRSGIWRRRHGRRRPLRPSRPPRRTATCGGGCRCGRRARHGAARAHRELPDGSDGRRVERQRERSLRRAEEPDPSRARQRARAAPLRRRGQRGSSQPRRVRDRRPARQETGLSRDDRQRLAAEIADDIFGYGPLERLLADPTVSEIMVNGPKDIWIERAGLLSQTR